MINFMQANLNKAKASQALIMQAIYEHRTDVAIISEQNRTPDNDSWYRSEDSTCCLFIARDVEVINYGQGHGFVWVDTVGLRVYSCYFSPSKRLTIDVYKSFLIHLADSIRQGPDEVIVAGDFNAHSPIWGSPYTCNKGEALTDMINSLNMVVMNQGNAPTYEKGGRASHIDVTFASSSISRWIQDWKVLDINIESDHNPIFFAVHDRVQLPRPDPKGWSWRRMDNSKLAAFISSYIVPDEDGVFNDDDLASFLEKACDSCMPRKKFAGHGKPVHWWSETIASLRKASFKARRVYQKARSRKGPDDCISEHMAAREASRTLRLEIRRSQEASWRTLCKQVDSDPWGLPYRIVAKKLIGRRQIPGLKTPGRMEYIVDTLFPRRQAPIYQQIQLQVPESCLFSLGELREAGLKLPRGRAPGPDGVPDAILRKIVMMRPQLLLPTFNACLRTCRFPDSWRKATLVLLRKGDKPLDTPSSYRPLCLLNSIAKLYERLLKSRLEEYLQSIPDGISDRQFGFVKGRSTVQAIDKVMSIVDHAGTGQLRRRELCALTSLDVANAFNTAPWDRIDDSLIKKRVPTYLIGCIRSYFCGRTIMTDDGSHAVSAGVPQGSVIGPILWNIFYDSLMRLNFPEGVHIVCFADDAAIIATGKSTQLLEQSMNDSLEMVAEWMDAHGLTISSSKSSAVMLTTKRGYVRPEFVLRGVRIELKDSLRYLGIELSSTLGFKKHIEVVSNKATRTASAIARLMPNVGGPSAEKRRLLSSVVHSQLLYAVPIWHGALKYERNKNNLAVPQRKMALRVASAYCTVSNAAVMVVAGIPPIHLLASERVEIQRSCTNAGADYESRLSAKKRTIEKWQIEWDNATKGRWTHRLIPKIDHWVKRKHGQVNYHMTQLLTGHGCFNAYLERFKKRDDAICFYCQHPQDDVEHTMFQCDRWWRLRQELEVTLNLKLTPENVVVTMLQSKRRWDAVAKFVDMLLSKKEEDERAIQITI